MTTTLNPAQQAFLKDVTEAWQFNTEDEALTAVLKHAAENARKLENLRMLVQEALDDPRPSIVWTEEAWDRLWEDVLAREAREEPIPDHVKG